MEFQNGLLAGMTREEAKQKCPETPDLPIHESRYGMESMLEFRFRAEKVLSQILSENAADSVVAIVSHGGMIQQLYRAFLRMPVDSENPFGFATGDTGFHEWVVRDGKRFIAKANYMVSLFKS